MLLNRLRACSAWLSRWCLVAAMAMAAGCGPVTINQRLVGTWVGQPETATQRDARSPQALLGSNGPGREADNDQPPPAGASLQTDLESVDVRVTLRFELDGGLTMSVGDGEEPLSGTWRLVTYDGEQALIELVAKRGGAGDEEKRRFDLQFVKTDDQAPDAFTLREEAADRLFGALYFQRQP